MEQRVSDLEGHAARAAARWDVIVQAKAGHQRRSHRRAG